MNFVCIGCTKPIAEVRQMVALPKHHICNECIDLCSEIVHENGDGLVKIGMADLLDLRKQAHEGRMARHWINWVRDSVAKADVELLSVEAQWKADDHARLAEAAPDLLDALRDVIGWLPGHSAWHTKAPVQAFERARAAVAKATGVQPQSADDQTYE